VQHLIYELSQALDGSSFAAVACAGLALAALWAISPYAAAPSFAVLGAVFVVRGVYTKVSSHTIPRVERAASRRLDQLDQRLRQRHQE
jgi:hypothetical protein